MADSEYNKLSIKKGLKLFFYHIFYVPFKSSKIRHQSKIDVVFVLSELGVWKTERLYMAMLKHNRFVPHIAVVYSREDPGARRILVDYLEENRYDFSLIEEDERIIDHFKADIIFYQKPYWWVIPDKQRMGYNRGPLYCYVPYGFFSIAAGWSINQTQLLFAWRVFMENESSASTLSRISLIKGLNFRVTGLPFEDDYIAYSEKAYDPWKESYRKRKRIVWAPHHTIPTQMRALDYSTFLDYAEFMLELAVRYKDEIQWAFKPHPLLRTKLNAFWGSERTDAYYLKWAEMENTQLVEGEYVDLLMHSDALIHDCGSFTMEYHYTKNPALYLLADGATNHTDNMIPYAAEAFNLHYFARNKDDIELFLKMVIAGDDEKSAARELYVNQYLTPSRGTAVDNIIKSILGQ